MSIKNEVIKLIVFGGVFGVGSSAIVIQFVSGHFVELYDPTLEEIYTKDIQVDGETVKLQITDTFNSDEYEALRFLNISMADGFVLTYSITSKESLEEIKGIYEEIYRVKHKNKNEPIPIIIVGNKCDLENEREVTKEEGMNYADNINCPFIECSAKTNENINQIFEIITRNILEQKYQREEEEIWTIKKPKREKGCCVV
ncbi:hypothetical protein, conserved [Entamoeba dispar SAW760]|uniref:Uncharacterized protein n=1 Tax=Entamoeba dispar (strain ATCC PRA-260 / SAW760) TaxID=370354 RepID=B0EKD1_ENTDS|nr:uncharacterized protein EDI_193450 [Entamoeba dispar SAW760]EDR25018.1 hypothetical protein, conserved [Entamoeba dispar SAW760]|eukprot:EDR25018.1 hypothetical protein, conserved [Entamoeba dispar SAW760]